MPSGCMTPIAKRAAGQPREGDQVAARRPYRRRVAALAEADAPRPAAAGAHDVELLVAAAIGVEHDLRSVRAVAGAGVDRARNWSAAARRRLPRSTDDDVRAAAARDRHDDAAAVRAEARREGHAVEIAEHLLAAGAEVEQYRRAACCWRNS